MSLLRLVPKLSLIKPIHRVSALKVPNNFQWEVIPGCGYYSTDSNKLIKVYEGSLKTKIRAVKVFSLTTSLTGIAAQPILMEQGAKIGGTPMIVFLCSFVGFFTFVTPLLLHFITKKYVTEMYYDPSSKEYNAHTISLLLQKVETKFKVEDVKVPDVPGMFTSFAVGKTKLFVDPSQFNDVDHYVKIMGFNKPIDFKLNIDDTRQNASDKKIK